MRSERLLSLAVALAAAAGAGCNMPRTAMPPVQDAMPASSVNPVIPAPRADAAEVPPGYRVEVVLTGLTYPSSVDVDDAGNVYVAEAGFTYGDPAAPARVYRVAPDGTINTIADQLNAPVTDLLWHDGRLLISHKGKVSALDSGGRLRDLVKDLPSIGDHQNNQLAVGPGGRIYVGLGTVTNSGVVSPESTIMLWLAKHPNLHDVPGQDVRVTNVQHTSPNVFAAANKKQPLVVNTTGFQPFGHGAAKDGVVRGRTDGNGTIISFTADGGDVRQHAWGLRNPFGLAFTQDGKLLASDNGFDDRGLRPIANAPDVIWSIRDGAFYGWPDYAGGEPVTSEKFRSANAPRPKFLMRNHPPVERPLMRRPPHAGVAKLEAARPGNAMGLENVVLLAESGDMTPMTGRDQEPAGFAVQRLDLASGQVQPFFRAKPDALGPKEHNLEYAQTPGPRRPVDVRFAPAGDAIYVADVGAIAVLDTAVPVPQPFPGTGVIWRITREGSPVNQPPANLSILPPTTQPALTAGDTQPPANRSSQHASD